MSRSEIVLMEILLRVDGVDFSCKIWPDGHYVLIGPVWMMGDAPVLSVGKMNCGYAFPGLVRSIENLIRLKLKT